MGFPHTPLILNASHHDSTTTSHLEDTRTGFELIVIHIPCISDTPFRLFLVSVAHWRHIFWPCCSPFLGEVGSR